MWGFKEETVMEHPRGEFFEMMMAMMAMVTAAMDGAASKMEGKRALLNKMTRLPKIT